MKVKVEVITPTRAKILLQHNTHNRSMSNRQVDYLAAQMKAGEWRDNGSTIVIATTGELLDGQHRLVAIIQAGVSVQMIVCREVDPAAMFTIDTGKARSVADVFKISGVGDYYTLSATMRRLYKWDTIGIVNNPKGGVKPSPHKLLNGLSQMEGVAHHREVNIAASKIRKAVGVSASNALCALHLLRVKHSWSSVKHFVELVVCGGDYPESPTHSIYKIRNNRIDSDQKQHRQEDLFLLMYCFERWAEEGKLRSVKFNWLNSEYAVDLNERYETGINWT